MTSLKEIFPLLRNLEKTLLFNNKEPWLKKFGDEEFDFPMECFDGAEFCELVGVNILHL